MVNVAVIGCGYWGPNLIRNFNQTDGSNLRTVCDLDEEKLRKTALNYPGIKTTKNYLDVLKDVEIDAVVVATPPATHFKIAKDALNAGKHVLVEKPLTDKSSHAAELIKIAKERNLVLAVDHTFEYAEPIKKMKEIIEAGELGDIYYIRAEWFNLGLLQPDVNVSWDLATHIVSIVSYITGEKVKSASANAEGYIRKNIPEIAHVHLKLRNGIDVYIGVGWLEPKKTRRITIVGSKKLLVFDLTNEEEPVKVYDKGVDLITPPNEISQVKLNYRYGDVYSPNVKNIEPLKTLCSHFIDCIRDGKSPRSGGDSGLNVIRVLEAIDESIKSGKSVVIE